jgi:aromatic ring-cleaving dioxygenase
MKYHAHVYWNDAEQRSYAIAMRIGLELLGCQLGRIHDMLIGPHPLAMYQAMYDDRIKEPVERMLNNESHGISILLHEDTSDDIHDHTEGVRWINNPLDLDIEWLEEYVKHKEEQ